MNENELAQIGAQAQIDLHLENWRVHYVFERDLCSAAGDPVYALCLPEKDSKRALIKVRDPETPPPGMTAEQWAVAIRTAVYHEVDHLHFAPFDNRSPAAVTAEENAVWGTTFALEAAWNVPPDCRLATIGKPRITAPVRRSQSRRSNMPDEKDNEKAANAGGDKGALLEIIANNDEKGALEWVKAYVARELSEGPESAPAPAPAAAPTADAGGGNMDQPNGGPMAARTGVRGAPSVHETEIAASARSARTSALRLAIGTARTVDGIALPPAVEKRILAARTLEEGEALLSTARDMAAIAGPRAARSGAEQKGKERDTSADGADLEGLAPHEIAAYDTIKRSDPKAAKAYLEEAHKVHARNARTSARQNAQKGK